MKANKRLRVAVVGAGLAGSTCARALADGGHAVRVVEAADRPGGRLATVTLDWTDARGLPRRTSFDHGAPGLEARTPPMQRFIDEIEKGGSLWRWRPVGARHAPPPSRWLHVPEPDMPSLCQRLLGGIEASWRTTATALRREHRRWRLELDGGTCPLPFDAVVVAVPPAMATPLLAPWRDDWARAAAIAPMQPCWTLTGVSASPRASLDWDVAQPEMGLLAHVARNESRPGRGRVAGEVHWVAHARAAWSRQFLDRPADWIQARMQQALADWLGAKLHWHCAAVHAWPQATLQPQSRRGGGSCWWDAGLGLGVCGDWLGGEGVEGAWLSGRALAEAIGAAATARRLEATVIGL